MVMTVLVDMQDNICVSHDKKYEGQPVSVVFDRADQSLSLVLSMVRRVGEKELTSEMRLGRVPLARIEEKIEQAQHIRLKQMTRDGLADDLVVPIEFRGKESLRAAS